MVYTKQHLNVFLEKSNVIQGISKKINQNFIPRPAAFSTFINRNIRKEYLETT